MTEFTCLLGEPALSDFRKRKLARRINDAGGAGLEWEARFVYLIESGDALDPSDRNGLQDLLHGEPVVSLDSEGLLLVVPRLGTQSPWSTKATDIAWHCGLKSVLRIERGVAYSLPGLAPEKRMAVGAVLHDRMTQSVLDSLDDAHALFLQSPPRPLVFIPVSVAGAQAMKKAASSRVLARSFSGSCQTVIAWRSTRQ